MESSTKKPSEATSIGKVRLATDCVMLTPVEKAVLIQLAMHCFDHPTTTEIGPAQIVINTCFKERAVREALKTLEQLGLITQSHGPSPLTSLKRIEWTALKIWRRVDPRRDWLAEQAGADESDGALDVRDRVEALTSDECKDRWDKQREARITRLRAAEEEI
jgi:hypothetical protein